jgi:hypothetical protein
VTIFDVAKLLGGELAITKLVGPSWVRYRVQFEPHLEIQSEGGLSGCCGFGDTERDALQDFVNAYAGKKVTIDSGRPRQQRTLLDLPEDLEVGENNPLIKRIVTWMLHRGCWG